MSNDQNNSQEEDQTRGQQERHNNLQNNHTQIDPEDFYSSEVRSADTRTWDIYRRSLDYSRDTTISYERTNLEDLVEGQDNFLGIRDEDPIPPRTRYLEERYYRTETVPRFAPDVLRNPIRTVVTLYPRGFPVFEFTDPTTGRTSYAAFPTARDERLDRNTRIILQALEISFLDPEPSPWEEFYYGS